MYAHCSWWVASCLAPAFGYVLVLCCELVCDFDSWA